MTSVLLTISNTQQVKSEKNDCRGRPLLEIEKLGFFFFLLLNYVNSCNLITDLPLRLFIYTSIKKINFDN